MGTNPHDEINDSCIFVCVRDSFLAPFGPNPSFLISMKAVSDIIPQLCDPDTLDFNHAQQLRKSREKTGYIAFILICVLMIFEAFFASG